MNLYDKNIESIKFANLCVWECEREWNSEVLGIYMKWEMLDETRDTRHETRYMWVIIRGLGENKVSN